MKKLHEEQKSMDHLMDKSSGGASPPARVKDAEILGKREDSRRRWKVVTGSALVLLPAAPSPSERFTHLFVLPGSGRGRGGGNPALKRPKRPATPRRASAGLGVHDAGVGGEGAPGRWRGRPTFYGPPGPARPREVPGTAQNPPFPAASDPFPAQAGPWRPRVRSRSRGSEGPATRRDAHVPEDGVGQTLLQDEDPSTSRTCGTCRHCTSCPDCALLRLSRAHLAGGSYSVGSRVPRRGVLFSREPSSPQGCPIQ
ncbi:uncharacterized protein LOC123393699 [Mustela putorius furo]|uniref:Uncharacterized protein LOC123393699 n=1 Tax=Mustela putorius furo TaxID=9669 RepID=A0A8U0SHM3_MUSPF|nr:uncharacterized protein LOC123393699 [Mustela putorius furo]